MPEKEWIIAAPIQVPADFQSAIGGHPLIAQTLYRRGIRTIDSAQAILDPDAYEPTPPNQLPDAQLAWELLSDTLAQHKRILVWGDFDVDGQTATATLVEGLRVLGGDIIFHIPVRAKESHGISQEVINAYLDRGFDLLLTCDTGISEHKSIQAVQDAGVPVIVTDHHSLGESLPPANAVVNPQRLPEAHPLRTLPGVGVAYKLMEGLFEQNGKTFDASYYMELAALGIVADVAKLQGDTRYLLQKGLESLRRTQRIGLLTLFKNAGLNPLHLNEDHIGFQIAPRLNAVGRLDDANPLVEFLTTDDKGRARVLATQIEAMNIKRRFETRQVEQGAESMLRASSEDRHAPAIVLHHPDWPGGVVGIVASRLVEQYQKPVILLTGSDPIHGSARSVQGVNITQAIATQSDILKSYGGHPMAAGLSLPAHVFGQFKRGFFSAIEERIEKVHFLPKLHIDQVLMLDKINMDLIDQVKRLSPFGPGNPPLNFMIPKLSLVSSSSIGGQGEHRQIIAADESEVQQRFIWWNGGDQSPPAAQFDLVCRLTKSDYKGNPQINAEWVDFRLSEKGIEQVARRHFEWIDYRDVLAPLTLLENLLKQDPQAQIWGEGDLPDGVMGLSREKLSDCKTLIIWTTPPSQSVLLEVLHRITVDKVIAVGIDPGMDELKTIMNRIGGLVKFVIRHSEHRTTLTALASACAVEKEIARVCLMLWESMGNISVVSTEEDIILRPEKTTPEQMMIEFLSKILEDLLSETRAFRHFFKTEELDSLMK